MMHLDFAGYPAFSDGPSYFPTTWPQRPQTPSGRRTEPEGQTEMLWRHHERIIIMSALSASRSAIYIAAIASVIGVVGTSAFANSASTASVLRAAQALQSSDRGAEAARAQNLDGSQRSTQRARSSDIIVSPQRSFDFDRLGHN
jgi:hypothetical protein